MPLYIARSERTGKTFKRSTPPAKPNNAPNAKPIPTYTHVVIYHLKDGRQRANWVRPGEDAEAARRWWLAQSACAIVELIPVQPQPPLTYPRWRAINNPLPRKSLLDGAQANGEDTL